MNEIVYIVDPVAPLVTATSQPPERVRRYFRQGLGLVLAPPIMTRRLQHGGDGAHPAEMSQSYLAASGGFGINRASGAYGVASDGQDGITNEEVVAG